MPETILTVEDLQVTLSGRRLLHDVSFRLEAGECLALTGASGSGKTLLLKALAGRLSHGGRVTYGNGQTKSPRVAFIARHHRFNNRSNLPSFYHQQRFNSFDSEDASTATEELRLFGATPAEAVPMLERFGIGHLKDQPLIRFSNGEHRRFQLAKAMLADPQWILLDNPLAGLDREARETFDRLVQELAVSGRHLVMAAGTGDLPAAVTRVALMEKGRIRDWMTRDAYLDTYRLHAPSMHPLPDAENVSRLATTAPEMPFENAVRMEGMSIRYEGRTILDDIDWKVSRGERWSLEGPNGSGKSTLLAVINGDNPQAHSQPLWMFDRRRGSGESIWDIKRRIGYLSPEMHQHFEAGQTGYEVVASGLFDTVGLFRKPNERQAKVVEEWMACMRVESFAGRSFHTLSDGEQRLLLIARALVKNPPLLIFDEPCQGLDEGTISWFRDLTDVLCSDQDRTLLYVSHYPGEIPGCVDKSAVMKEGRMTIKSNR